MSSTDNNSEVAIEKGNDKLEKSADKKSEVKGTKRPAEDKSDDVKKLKTKEENGEEEDVEDEEDVEGEEEEDEEDIPEEEEEDEGDGEGEDDEEDA